MKFAKKLSKHQFFPLIIWDTVGIFSAFLVAFLARFDGLVPVERWEPFLWTMLGVIGIYTVINILSGLYAHIWRYTSAHESLVVVTASITSTSVIIMLMLGYPSNRPLPLGAALLGGLLSTVVLVLNRYRQRILTGLMARLERVVGSPDRQRVLIVGAGEAGQILARQLHSHSASYQYELVGFVDDDPDKQHLHLHGVPVLGTREQIPHLVQERSINLIVIAIHSISGPNLRDMLTTCLDTQAKVKIMPDFIGSIGQRQGSKLLVEDITPTDLLGREPYTVDEVACQDLIADKVVLVTGAAGSIGSELCRQVLKRGPRRLLILDNNETGLHNLKLSLNSCNFSNSGLKLDSNLVVPVVSSVTNEKRLETIFETHRPSLVFHAAAYKHVPLMEQHPSEAIMVNTGGTFKLAMLAAKYHTERFVLISTDKAVNPGSIMGASKRACELVLANMPNLVSNQPNGPAPNPRVNGHGGSNGVTHTFDTLFQVTQTTRFTAVRFGNVLGSRGSVVPTFIRQIEQGGPITITDPNMSRYFMSIAEAVSLVIQAATLTQGNDLFMLDMGQEIRIVDLAHKLIRLRGLRPGHDIELVYTGIRPGEKLHEELTMSTEVQEATSHAKIFRVINSHQQHPPDFADQIHWLIALAEAGRDDEAKELLWYLTKSTAIAVDNKYPVLVG